MLLLQLMEL